MSTPRAAVDGRVFGERRERGQRPFGSLIREMAVEGRVTLLLVLLLHPSLLPLEQDESLERVVKKADEEAERTERDLERASDSSFE